MTRINRRLYGWGSATSEKAVALMWTAYAIEQTKPQIADRMYEVAAKFWALAPKAKKLQAAFGELGDAALDALDQRAEAKEQGADIKNEDTGVLLNRLIAPMSPTARKAFRRFLRLSSYANELEKETQQLLKDAEAP